MNETSVILRAYYEALYDLLVAEKDIMAARIDKLLAEEIAIREFESFDQDKYAAYQEACMAFVDERIEAYNPIGIQYVYDRCSAKEAFELELQLNWYDSRKEFRALVEAARNKSIKIVSDEELRSLAEELINEVGAFPDKSIIFAYESKPGLSKLPDYVVAKAIEEIITEN